MSRNSFEKEIWPTTLKYPKNIQIGKNVLRLHSSTIVARTLVQWTSSADKYKASIFVMTSRQEGFPMVLIEAMARLASVLLMTVLVTKSNYKHWWRRILVQDGNEDDFVEKLNRLIEEVDLRKSVGSAAESVSQYMIVILLWTNGMIYSYS
jgi:hypothetical protein